MRVALVLYSALSKTTAMVLTFSSPSNRGLIVLKMFLGGADVFIRDGYSIVVEWKG